MAKSVQHESNALDDPYGVDYFLDVENRLVVSEPYM